MVWHTILGNKQMYKFSVFRFIMSVNFVITHYSGYYIFSRIDQSMKTNMDINPFDE